MSQHQQYQRLAEFVEALKDLEQSIKEDLARDCVYSEDTLVILSRFLTAHAKVERMLTLATEIAGKAN